MNKIYENIKAIRQAKGLTQTYLAEKVGIAINNYGKLERGEIQLTIERLEQLAGIFGMTVIKIMQYGGGVESVKEIDNEKVKELEKMILAQEKLLIACNETINLYKQNSVLMQQKIDSLKKQFDDEEELRIYIVDFNAALKIDLLRDYQKIIDSNLNEIEKLQAIDKLINGIKDFPIFSIEYDLKMTLAEFHNSNPKYQKYFAGGMMVQISNEKN